MSQRIRKAIQKSGLTIYDSLDGRPDLFLANASLERMLQAGLKGLNLVCSVLGYPIPTTFRRTKPRFPGQNFDTYVQKSDNLQIWNDDISASIRYVLIRLDSANAVTRVRVVSGEVLADLDTTRTLTQKYQARSRRSVTESCLVSSGDTDHVVKRLMDDSLPDLGGLLRIRDVYTRLLKLIGRRIPNVGLDQERNRGGGLYLIVREALDCLQAADTGQFPDILKQLVEIKLQTSPTVDLGLVSPDDKNAISDLPMLRHCDVRYAIFYGIVEGDYVALHHLVMTTGEDFFRYFRRFEGQVTNKKLQIPLPRDFFD